MCRFGGIDAFGELGRAFDGVPAYTVFFGYDLCGTRADTFGPILGTKVFPIKTALRMIPLRHLLRFILAPDQIRFLRVGQISAAELIFADQRKISYRRKNLMRPVKKWLML